MMRFNLRGEKGTSFVELVVAMLLLAVLALLVSKYMQMQERSAMDDRARTDQMYQVLLWLNIFERDMKYREHPKSGELGPLAPTFRSDINVYRLTPLKGGGEGTMWSHYYTYCQDLDAKITKKYGSLVDFSAQGLKARFGANHQYKCLAHVNCRFGKYPQIVMTLYNTADKVLPSYPTGRWGGDGSFRAVLPEHRAKDASADRVVAAALCAQPGGNRSEHVTMETAVLFEETTIRFARKEIIIPRHNTARLQVLP